MFAIEHSNLLQKAHLTFFLHIKYHPENSRTHFLTYSFENTTAITLKSDLFTDITVFAYLLISCNKPFTNTSIFVNTMVVSL
jgi:hypothetical protein